MNILSFFLLVLVITIIILFIIKFLLPHRKIFYFIVILLLLLVVLLFLSYFYNSSFRDFINVNFYKTSSHTYTTDNIHGGTIPLPPNTANKFRTSDTDATYITKTKVNDIISFYNDLADLGSFKQDLKFNEIQFRYRNRHFKITIKEDVYRIIFIET